METFQYDALDAAGRTLSGVMQADTPRQARAQLRAQGLLPARVEPLRARQVWARGISAMELSLLTRQMATLLGSGLTVEQTLTALIEEAADPRAREILSGVKAEVAGGLSLAGALGTHSKSFPEFYRALVHGGEESGALPTVLDHLADYLDSQQALKQKTGLALLYPALVTVVALLIVTGLLVYVVPQIAQVFQQSRQTLPWLTRALIALSDFLRTGLPVFMVLLLGGLAALRAALRRPAPRLRWDAWLLRLPWLGSLIRSVNTARFAATLSILLGGGVPLLSALQSGARVMGNSALRAAVLRVAAQVREGEGLARALAATRLFPPLLTYLVASGEMSGKLDHLLERAARLETQALERRLAVFLTLLEPLMILVMGAIVLLIVLAILLPIIEINQLVRM
jgi:general secretion pathway protein F